MATRRAVVACGSRDITDLCRGGPVRSPSFNSKGWARWFTFWGTRGMTAVTHQTENDLDLLSPTVAVMDILYLNRRSIHSAVVLRDPARINKLAAFAVCASLHRPCRYIPGTCIRKHNDHSRRRRAEKKGESFGFRSTDVPNKKTTTPSPPPPL